MNVCSDCIKMGMSIFYASIGFIFCCYVIFQFRYKGSRNKKRIRKLIENRILIGNEVAIQMKLDRLTYKIEEKDYNLIVEALNGNEHAIRALGIVIRERK